MRGITADGAEGDVVCALAELLDGAVAFYIGEYGVPIGIVLRALYEYDIAFVYAGPVHAVAYRTEGIGRDAATDHLGGYGDGGFCRVVEYVGGGATGYRGPKEWDTDICGRCDECGVEGAVFYAAGLFYELDAALLVLTGDVTLLLQ